MPLLIPDDGSVTKQLAKIIQHLTNDTEFAPYVDMPILDYPTDGLPSTHPERVVCVTFLDDDLTFADNMTNQGKNGFLVRVQIRETGETYDEIRAANQIARNLKDILQQSIWRYRKDDCSPPGLLWYRLEFTSPSSRIYRNRETRCQVLEVGFRVSNLAQNRPK